MSGNGLLFILLGVGALVWYESSQQQSTGATQTPPAGAGVNPPTTPPPASGSGSAPAAPPSVPAYSGPTLAQMYAALQNAVAAQWGVDPALTCGVGLQGLGIQPRGSVVNPRSSLTVSMPAVQTHGGHTLAVAGGVTPRTSQTPVSGSKTCPVDSITATYPVFNYYLLKAVPSIGTVPNAPDNTTTVTLAQYWQWAAPLLQQQITGLSGFRGMYPMNSSRLPVNRPGIARSYAHGGWGR